MIFTLFKYHIFVAKHFLKLTYQGRMNNAACGKSLFCFGEMYNQLFGAGEHNEYQLQALIFLVIGAAKADIESFIGI